MKHRAFTIIELLVVVSIIALLVGILLPALGKARDRAKTTESLANLRQLATAHANYASDWNDRQVTWALDNLTTYGSVNSLPLTLYNNGPTLGDTSDGATWSYTAGGLCQPFYWSGQQANFGTFRLMNAREFNQYVTGKFYSQVWYAPKDSVVISYAERCFDDPNEFCWLSPPNVSVLQLPAWSSYCMSPAAMFNPQVFSGPNPNSGPYYRDPWSLPAGFRSPALSQAKFSDLKTHVIEHHWLQNPPQECNPRISGGTYDGCEPYYFNLSPLSQPATMFFDGHVETMTVQAAISADALSTENSGKPLYSRDTPNGANGYFGQARVYQNINTCPAFHIFTANGIRGRDRDAG